MSVRPALTTARIPALAALGLAATALAACSDIDVSQGAGKAATTIAVTSTDDACRLSATTAPTGKITFTVVNKGTKATEFYVLTTDEKVVGEVEDIGPGTSRELGVTARPGSYLVRCRPGQTGDGITTDFTVTR